MEARESWHALKAKLTEARKLFNAGDCARALEEVDAALAIDPQCLAAHSLRDRILAGPLARSTRGTTGTKAPTSPYLPPVPGNGYARIEERAKLRRVGYCIDAARTAIDSRNSREAVAALDELTALDPNLPELASLTAALAKLRLSPPRRHRGSWLAAAAAFGAIVLGASWLEESSAAQSPPAVTTADVKKEVRPTLASPTPVIPAIPAIPVINVANIPTPASGVSPVSPVNAASPISRDEIQVRQALQRYRVAYEGLDAQSAQAVWPSADPEELARDFDGLESQRLTFDACRVQMAGVRAAATCRGTARYVPKAGSREPLVEARVWSFALRKIGAEWKIDNARADR